MIIEPIYTNARKISSNFNYKMENLTHIQHSVLPPRYSLISIKYSLLFYILIFKSNLVFNISDETANKYTSIIILINHLYELKLLYNIFR